MPADASLLNAIESVKCSDRCSFLNLGTLFKIWSYLRHIKSEKISKGEILLNLNAKFNFFGDWRSSYDMYGSMSSKITFKSKEWPQSDSCALEKTTCFGYVKLIKIFYTSIHHLRESCTLLYEHDPVRFCKTTIRTVNWNGMRNLLRNCNEKKINSHSWRVSASHR